MELKLPSCVQKFCAEPLMSASSIAYGKLVFFIQFLAELLALVGRKLNSEFESPFINRIMAKATNCNIWNQRSIILICKITWGVNCNLNQSKKKPCLFYCASFFYLNKLANTSSKLEIFIVRRHWFLLFSLH